MSEKCGEKCEVYSRVCGYFRPVANWNKGKQEEFKERETFKIPGSLLAILAALLLPALTGCASTMRGVTDSAGGKNLNLDGYVMLGELETANPETGTPNGKLIIGHVTYKSRKVGIPTDQKVPTAGYFKSTKTKSFFGTEEEIVEYDFTAGSDADAREAMRILEEKRKQAEAKVGEGKTDNSEPSSPSDTVENSGSKEKTD